MATDPNAFTVEDVEEEASDPEGPDAWEVRGRRACGFARRSVTLQR